MTKIITRFAPSPTGLLHVGNARTALINFLYARNKGGEFILRIDDTDRLRSTEGYKKSIERDLKWLGLNWDESFEQSSRLDKYDLAKQKLIDSNRLYPCYETAEELEIKRKLQLSSGKPPIYDRSSLALSDEVKAEYEKLGRKPHYRFFIENKPIEWDDMVKGKMHYDGKYISDPIVIREDGTMTYMLCSTVDDAEYNISHIIRGEDHVSNTAVQLQMFEALGFKPPICGHLSLVKTAEDKISKRKGGFEIEALKNEAGLEPMAINSFFAAIGTSNPLVPYMDMAELIEAFDISKFSTSPTTYMPEELTRLNHKMVVHMEYDDVAKHLASINASHITKEFWDAVRANLETVKDSVEWWKICHELPAVGETLDKDLISKALELLPSAEIADDTWKNWSSSIGLATGLKGRELFLPLRLALTGMGHGPEMAKLLPLIGRAGIVARLERY